MRRKEGMLLVATIFIATFIIMVSCSKEDPDAATKACIIFTYYNRDVQTGVVIDIATVDGSVLTGWRQNASLKIITHGWLSSAAPGPVEDIKNAYIQMFDHNIITVDWGKAAKINFYGKIIHRAKVVGMKVAELIDVLVNQGLVTDDAIHMIGHSAGAHVMGVAGAFVKSGAMGRISGLDAADPGFDLGFQPKRNVLDPTDAKFVDCIHTTIALGYNESLGTVDFWPNGKIFMLQPGCKGVSCSHGRAYNFFADSILNPHTYLAHKCTSFKKYRKGECDNEPTTYMGDETPADAVPGDYYLETNEQAPYGQG